MKKINFMIANMAIPAMLLSNAALYAFGSYWGSVLYVCFFMLLMCGHNLYIMSKDGWSSRATRLACAHADATIGFIGCAILMFFGNVHIMSMFILPITYFAVVSAFVAAYVIWRLAEIFDDSICVSEE